MKYLSSHFPSKYIIIIWLLACIYFIRATGQSIFCKRMLQRRLYIYIIIMTFRTQSYTYNTPLYNKTLYAHHHSRISYPPHVWSAGLDVDVNGGSHNYVYICVYYIYIFIVRSRVIGLLYYIDRPIYIYIWE